MINTPRDSSNLGTAGWHADHVFFEFRAKPVFGSAWKAKPIPLRERESKSDGERIEFGQQRKTIVDQVFRDLHLV